MVCKYGCIYSLQHWIRLEMLPDIIISKLSMTVDPADSSYTPSLVVVSGGEYVNTLCELRTVNISPSDRQVTLLEDMQEV
jgi:E3 ubiquitin-protein ligase HERC2